MVLGEQAHGICSNEVKHKQTLIYYLNFRTFFSDWQRDVLNTGAINLNSEYF